jgi:hypothetical protein
VHHWCPDAEPTCYCRPQYGDENLSTRFLQERRRLRDRNRLGKLDELIAISEEFRPGIAIDLNELIPCASSFRSSQRAARDLRGPRNLAQPPSQLA